MNDIYVEDRLLDHIRLVCSSAHCTTTRPDINGRQHLVHKTICMNPYIFKSHTRQFFMNEEFATCEVMDEDGKCKKCGCGWSKHMATKYETVAKKKSTDKVLDEDESFLDQFYERDEEKTVEISQNGDALIKVSNLNDPSSRRSSRHSIKKDITSKFEEEKSKNDDLYLSTDYFNDPPKRSSRRSSRHSIKKDSMSKLEEEKSKNNELFLSTGDSSGSSSRRSSKKSINKDNMPKLEEEPKLDTEKSVTTNDHKDSTNKDAIPKLADEIKIEEIMPWTVWSHNNEHHKNSTKEYTNQKLAEKSKIKEVKPLTFNGESAIELARSKTTSVTANDLQLQISKSRPKTTEVEMNDLPKKSITLEPVTLDLKARSKTAEVDLKDLPHKNGDLKVGLDDLPKKSDEIARETSPKRRFFKFKTMGVNSNNLPKKCLEPSQHASKFKTTAVYSDNLPKNTLEEGNPKRRSIKFKEEFNEINDVFGEHLGDHTSASKLLRFSDVIHIADKEISPESSRVTSNNSETTVYANVDRNVIKSSPEKTKTANGNIPKAVDSQARYPNNGNETNKNRSTPNFKPRKARFNQNGEPTLASSTITRNSNRKTRQSANMNCFHPTVSGLTNEIDEDEIRKELACQEEEEIANLGEGEEDTRSEKCRRWLVDNPVVKPQDNLKRPEKSHFLNRLKRFVFGTASRLKNRFMGRAPSKSNQE